MQNREKSQKSLFQKNDIYGNAARFASIHALPHFMVMHREN